ncbi:MAG: HAMP domain-containing histidine kinase [Ignavibacteria bacterium]|nr:HAMP domain-containing histidine kinase [Ignavibacteria bacterium]
MNKFNRKLNFPLFFKLLLLSGILIIVIILISLLFNYSYNKLSEKDKLNEIIIHFNELNQTLRSMAERVRDNLNQTYYSDKAKIVERLNSIDSLTHILNFQKNEEFNKEFENYRKNINSFLENLLELGLSENEGLEGEFRKNIHKLEKFFIHAKDYKSLFYLLQARRREKDFLLRHRKEYVEQVQQNIELLSKRINRIYTSVDFVKQYLNNYIKSFENYFHSYFKYRQSYLSIHNNQKRLSLLLDKELEKLTQEAETAYKVVNPIMFISVLMGFILTLIYAQTITKPVNELQKATLQVANGNLKVKVEINTNDEFSILADFFNNMVNNLEQNNYLILKKNEELEKMNNELKTINTTKDRLFSIIAHDLKNPVSNFKTMIEYLNKNYQTFSEEEKKEFLEELQHSAVSVYDLLENLLQWSFTQLKRTTFNPQEFDINYVVETVLNHLHSQAKAKNIALINKVPNNCVVFADVFMITTVLRNLASNAIKFTNNGGKITIDLQKNESHCIISVQDTGIGIPKENINKLFNLDYKISTKGTNNESGTGLGLLLCKDFVEKNGGKIWVESEVNKGTTFYFSLPLVN